MGDVERLQDLTDDLLVLPRIDSEVARPHGPVELSVIVVEALQALRRQDIQVTTLGLDGTITVTDTDPHGATFTVDLPEMTDQTAPR